MNSCDFPADSQPTPTSEAVTTRISEAGSRLHAFLAGANHSWNGVPPQAYKRTADHHAGVLRSTLVGDEGEPTSFHLRYFEIAPGGFTTREQHRHVHVVFVLRGTGTALVADIEHTITFGDLLYIAPNDVHQLRNGSTNEMFGFLCLVDAIRDRPVPVGEGAGEASSANDETGARL